MGTTDNRHPAPLPSSPRDEAALFTDFYREQRRHRTARTSSARRAPAMQGQGRSSGRNPWYSVPTIRKLAALLARLLPAFIRGSKAAQAARRNPGLTAWLILFTAVGLTIVAPGSSRPHPDRNPKRYRAWLQARGEDAVRACIAEIGFNHAVMPTVQAAVQPEWFGGTYSPWQDTIEFNARHEFSDTGLLAIAAHESVHALFDQYALRLVRGPREDFNLLVEETTAEILGAHIAGNAWSRMGHDGAAYTAWLIDQHRKDCNPRLPGSIAQRYFASGSRDDQLMPFHFVLVHFGPQELVEAVVEICERERLPVNAARAVARRFIRDRLEPCDRPILDEFHRRKWPSADSELKGNEK